MTEERLVAKWTERPYHSHDRMSEVVRYRVRVVAHEDVGVDVQHEVRHEDDDEWTPAEVYESRPHGIERIRADDRWWAT